MRPFSFFTPSTMLNGQDPNLPSNEGEAARDGLSQPMTQSIALTGGTSEFLSARDVSSLLGVALVSVYRLAERRALPAYRFLRKLLFRRSDVLAWVESKRTEPRGPSVCR